MGSWNSVGKQIYKVTLTCYVMGNEPLDGRDWARDQLHDMASQVSGDDMEVVVDAKLFREIMEYAISPEVMDLPYPANMTVVAAKLILAHKKEVISSALLDQIWGMVERLMETVRECGMPLDELLGND